MQFASQKLEIIAKEVHEGLKPFCTQISVAGDLRRGKDIIKSLEFVCVPKLYPKETLWEPDTCSQPYRSPGFIREVKRYKVLQGNPQTDTLIVLKNDGVRIKIHVVDEQSYAGTLLQKTGPATFCNFLFGYYIPKRRKLAYRLGTIKGADGVIYAPKTEESFFEVIGLPYIAPAERDHFRKHLPFTRTAKQAANTSPINLNNWFV